ncbi:alpha/beta hydrolase, partial [Sphingopyxis sp.]|uniref:alpha/beta hydrolase n=1 Tax=Sphingopyxis sp. TaxID=1908224 RepID=UPI002B466654
MREAYEAMGTIFTVAQGVRTARATLGYRPAEWYVPDTGPQNGILLYLHGGGYAIGSINTHRHLVSEMARQTGCAAV